ncbi:hypothetical protein [Mesorhizobium sp.]|uniref:hypothetical protein n=1 Tax=Mesorhizobium sp. TaxID=1871066 RepID=UPI000FE7C910|nr:hypothetical protein [Mesorhizobium sp.]RWK56805.1 MAG: hypothetical protein EOR49_34555 [Mesorhizobium sp.]RWM40734.1 MAG: hypothetical protein EOR76_35465 [Mesorhizobium sp.]
MDLARESLDEVKALTDYRDGKATRLLTIITFLSALAGVLFGKLADLYPLHASLAQPEATWWHLALIGNYLIFCPVCAKAYIAYTIAVC